MSHEFPPTFESKEPPSYQSLDDFGFRPAGEGEKAQIELRLPESAMQEFIEMMAKVELLNRYWWLRGPWQEKGLPKEQLRVIVGEKTFDIFNYRELLEDHQIESIKKIISIFFEIKDGVMLSGFHTILIDDTDSVNPKSGELKYGEVFADNVIHLTARTLREEAMPRLGDVNTLEAVLAHEISHSIATFYKEHSVLPEHWDQWRTQFGWLTGAAAKKELGVELPRSLKGGMHSYWVNRNEDRVINDYARQDPNEDFCESFAAALLGSANLDPERLAYIKEHFLDTKSGKSADIHAERRTGDQVELPRIDTDVTYTIKTIKKGVIRRVE